MPVANPTRRAFAAATAAWLASRALPAEAVPSRNGADTGVWTGSVLLDGDGRSFVLTDLQAPLVLLKLWAGWCPACAQELPQLTTLAAAMGRSVEVVLISHPQYWDADQIAARRRKLPFRLATFAPSTPSAVTEQALLQPNGTFVVPRSLVFRERDRSIVLKREGATDWASDSALAQVRTLLG